MRAACFLCCLLLHSAAAAQTPPDVLASYAQARQLVDNAVAAHGGIAALDAVRQIRVTTRGHQVWRTQSRSPSAPFDQEPISADMMIDLAQGRLVSTGTQSYPGGIHRAWRWVTAPEQSYYIDLRNEMHEERDFPAAETQTGNLYTLPQWLLAKVLQNPGSLRALGRMRLTSGTEVDVVTATAQGSAITLGFDPETGLVRAVLGIAHDVLSGDAVSEAEFLDYRPMNGLLMPSRRVQRLGGTVTMEYAYTSVTPNYTMPDSLVAPPPGSALHVPAETEEVRALATGVWLIGSYAAVLAVEFSDHVMVVDAPPGARNVIDQLATLAPGKPIRYVVPTHHHDDHAIGIREYALAGATIVATPRNRDYLAQMVTARPTTGAALPALAGEPPFELLAGAARTFSDGERTVEVHNIGAGPHALDMLVAWLPAEGILYQADLIEPPPALEPMRASNNETTVHFGEWLRGRGWNVRVFAGAHGTLAEPEDFARILAQPLKPPSIY